MIIAVIHSKDIPFILFCNTPDEVIRCLHPRVLSKSICLILWPFKPSDRYFVGYPYCAKPIINILQTIKTLSTYIFSFKQNNIFQWKFVLLENKFHLCTVIDT